MCMWHTMFTWGLMKHYNSEANIIDSRYSAEKYNTISNKMRKEESKNFLQTLNSEKTPHSSPLRASYGASFLSSSGNRCSEISRVHHVSLFAYTWWSRPKITPRSILLLNQMRYQIYYDSYKMEWNSVFEFTEDTQLRDFFLSTP